MNWEFRNKQASGAQTEKRLTFKFRRATRSRSAVAFRFGVAASADRKVNRRLDLAGVVRAVLGIVRSPRVVRPHAVVRTVLRLTVGLGLGLTLLGNPAAESYAFERPADDFRLRIIHPAIQQGNTSPYTKPEPAYAKWGKLAVAETKARYPNAQVVDYLHVGRQNLDDGLAKETFKLWLRSPAKEFGVLVTITFEKSTEKVRSIEFCETAR